MKTARILDDRPSRVDSLHHRRLHHGKLAIAPLHHQKVKQPCYAHDPPPPSNRTNRNAQLNTSEVLVVSHCRSCDQVNITRQSKNLPSPPGPCKGCGERNAEGNERSIRESPKEEESEVATGGALYKSRWEETRDTELMTGTGFFSMPTTTDTPLSEPSRTQGAIREFSNHYYEAEWESTKNCFKDMEKAHKEMENSMEGLKKSMDGHEEIQGNGVMGEKYGAIMQNGKGTTYTARGTAQPAAADGEAHLKRDE